MAKRRPVQVLLGKEFLSVKKNPRSEFFQVYDLVRNNIQEWEIYVIGPNETPYEGGVYRAILSFPDDYPMKPPSLRFTCNMLHPNIYRDGKVCISTLQTGADGNDSLGQYWRPVLGVEQAILSVVSLLSDPNLADPANTGAANLYHSHRQDFNQKCKTLAKKSLETVPADFEYPKVNHEQPKKTEAKEKREGLRPQLEVKQKNMEKPVVVEDDDDDEDFRYDLEDMSSDEEEDEAGESHLQAKEKKISRDEDDNDNGGSAGGSPGVNKRATSASKGNTNGTNKGNQDSPSSDNSQATGQGTNQARIDNDISLLERMEAESDVLQRLPRRSRHSLGFRVKRISMGMGKSLLGLGSGLSLRG